MRGHQVLPPAELTSGAKAAMWQVPPMPEARLAEPMHLLHNWFHSLPPDEQKRIAADREASLRAHNMLDPDDENT